MSDFRHPQLDIEIEHIAPSALLPNPRNPRAHSKRQLAKLKIVIEANGFINPIIIDEKSMVLAGHARRQVAIELGLESVPCVRLTDLSEAQKIAVTIADNKMTDESQFDIGSLSILLSELDAVYFQVEHTGFETAEIDILLDAAVASMNDPADDVVEPDSSGKSVSRTGELWRLAGIGLRWAMHSIWRITNGS